MTFLYPQYLYLLLLIPILIVGYYWYNSRNKATFLFPSLLFLKGGYGWRVYLRHIPFVLRLIALSAVFIALARPQTANSWQAEEVEGIDIMLTMDVSGSMLAMDFTPNRLEAAKKVAFDFIKNRPNDQIGLVLFSGESFTSCPLTMDHGQLLNRLSEVSPGLIEDGTAIGVGLATAINRLKDSKAKSKVIILLTDGVNNRSQISPKTAAELAKTYGVSIYTIGMGSDAKEAPFPVQLAFGVVTRTIPVELDETMLREIADLTGGQYFRATDNNSLAQIYKDIDKLEKTKLTTRSGQTKYEQFTLFALIALIALLLEYILRNTYLRTNP